MTFTLPTPPFDAVGHASLKLQRANELENVIIIYFKSAYENFWGVGQASGPLHTTAEMQSVLEAMSMDIALQVLTQASALVSYIDYAAPGVLEDKYKETAFTYEIVNGAIVLGDLKSHWYTNSTRFTEECLGGAVCAGDSVVETIVG